MTQSPCIVYLNGNYLPIEKAQISVTDRGFLFGDAVYEVIPIYSGKLFRLECHLKRLQNSLNAIRIDFKIDTKEWNNICKELIAKNKSDIKHQLIYLQISRGATLHRDHIFPEEIVPTIFAQCVPVKKLSFETISQGLSAITIEDTRWKYCYIKSTALLANVLLRQQAYEANASEAILIRDGYVMEGSSSNVFAVKNDTILTPPLNEYILGGITREFILELARKHKLPLEETPILRNELKAADEVWVTSSVREIFPIIKVDHQVINNGNVGDMWKRMIKYYHEEVEQ